MAEGRQRGPFTLALYGLKCHGRSPRLNKFVNPKVKVTPTDPYRKGHLVCNVIQSLGDEPYGGCVQGAESGAGVLATHREHRGPGVTSSRLGTRRLLCAITSFSSPAPKATVRFTSLQATSRTPRVIISTACLLFSTTRSSHLHHEEFSSPMQGLFISIASEAHLHHKILVSMASPHLHGKSSSPPPLVLTVPQVVTSTPAFNQRTKMKRLFEGLREVNKYLY